jgi:erythronate-4-phosphate dehydrogenase
MKIIIDDKIPYMEGALEPFAEVVYLPGNLTTAEAVKDADALITRTRTLCNRDVLEGSKVRFIATATIGFDHIDTRYCKAEGIEWINAPGCNAQSVNQYISSALVSWSMKKGLPLKDKTIGIVGVGQVGSRVAETCDVLGMKVLLNDPPRERSEGPSQFVSLRKIQEQADIISFHVPLNMAGVDRTYHMVNRQFLENLERKPLIINSSRGEVFFSEDVLFARGADRIAGMVIDCWENEPRLDLDLLKLADYGIPHIAGYSQDGKANGTKTSVRAVSRFFGLGIDDWEPPFIDPPRNPAIELDGSGQNEASILAEAILSTYDIGDDDAALRNDPESFEQLRGDYPVRREFDSFSIRAANIEPETLNKLGRLGFRV